ncbi:protein-L-isoaspartate(D-aspartate) O-methyltransferase [Luteolibacter ambystomatis]
MDYARARERMVKEQIEARGVREPRVLAAMRAVPRENFVAEGLLPWIYEDQPLSIGRGQTISQPYMVALMTELLGTGPDATVLEIGAGCGYQTAILSRLVGRVCSIERDETLAAEARMRLAGMGCGNVELIHGDGFLGWPEPGRQFLRILAACAAEEIPVGLLDQLAPGGRLVIPIGPAETKQELTLVDRDWDGLLHTQVILPVRFVPMVHGSV